MAQNFLQKNWKMLTVLVAGIIIFAALFGVIELPQAPLTTVEPELPDEVLGINKAKWTIYVTDELDSSSTVTAGTLELYSPAEPGKLIESLSVNASATTTSEYPEGKQFFCLYYHASSTWLRYGKVLTMPAIGDYDTVETLRGGEIFVYKRADFNVAADIQGLKNGDKVWDKDTSATNSFNVTADKSDTDPPKIGVRLNNEDDNTAYCDPRGFYDYSVPASTAVLYANKASYLSITFERTGGLENVSDVREYVTFEDESGWTLYQQSNKYVYIFVPLNTELLAGTREKSSGVIIQSGQLVTILTRTFDWPASMSTDIYIDDIDIELAIVSAYSVSAIETKIEQDDMDILGELGSSGAAWSNDWSIGDM